MPALRFPSCDCEQSHNFRAHQICLSYTDSDNLILQQESETVRVSNVQLLLFSQPVGLGLLVELQTSGVEHSAANLAAVRDLAFDASEVLLLLHWAKFFSGFPVRRPRHSLSHSTTQLDEKSRSALLDFRVRGIAGSILEYLLYSKKISRIFSFPLLSCHVATLEWSSDAVASYWMICSSVHPISDKDLRYLSSSCHLSRMVL